MSPGRYSIFAGGQANLSPSGATFGVDLERSHVSEIEHNASLGDAVMGVAVTAAAHGELQTTLARQSDDVCNIGIICDADNDRRPAVDPAIENGAGFVIYGVVRRDHPAFNNSTKLWDGEPFFDRSEKMSTAV
jgi:hypothetical protein